MRPFMRHAHRVGPHLFRFRTRRNGQLGLGKRADCELLESCLVAKLLEPALQELCGGELRIRRALPGAVLKSELFEEREGLIGQYARHRGDGGRRNRCRRWYQRGRWGRRDLCWDGSLDCRNGCSRGDRRRGDSRSRRLSGGRRGATGDQRDQSRGSRQQKYDVTQLQVQCTGVLWTSCGVAGCNAPGARWVGIGWRRGLMIGRLGESWLGATDWRLDTTVWICASDRGRLLRWSSCELCTRSGIWRTVFRTYSSDQ